MNIYNLLIAKNIVKNGGDDTVANSLVKGTITSILLTKKCLTDIPILLSIIKKNIEEYPQHETPV